MCPFHYGIDFGLIGGLQAMVGVLKVLQQICYHVVLYRQKCAYIC